ncbi:uncharacterized protein LOC113345546 [Papaver somniferum]|uniref:uncharacterized protein LOC113345546 n=1 Tax=Papaver somniferum TaxID=3469 RepID=UPI000E6FB818|nr:uncharacterized protein LOC113345546 [Papaver somniferum]
MIRCPNFLFDLHILYLTVTRIPSIENQLMGFIFLVFAQICCFFFYSNLFKSVVTTLYISSLTCIPPLYSLTRNNTSSFFKDCFLRTHSPTVRFHWLIFEAMRIKCARSSDLELRMLKERMFLPISGEWILPQTS